MNDTINEPSIIDITKTLISSIVDHPEDLQFEEVVGKASIVIGVKTPQESDISQIIGIKGTTITAIKQIIEQIAMRRKVRCTIYVG